ncbi:hypothetical protein ACEXQD_14825 [Herbiconiux sp. P15]|uniref:hypothetical protein n=1 Tax=Herbiconiux liukaitaii TaxID=3342799 RepID=UPI0035B871C0
MKKADLEKRIKALARSHAAEWSYLGGTKHDKYSLNGTIIMIPRHREIGESLAAKILKDCYRALDDMDD